MVGKSAIGGQRHLWATIRSSEELERPRLNVERVSAAASVPKTSTRCRYLYAFPCSVGRWRANFGWTIQFVGNID